LGRFHVVRVQRGDREVLLYEAVAKAAMVRRPDWRRIRIPSVWAMGDFLRSQAPLQTFNPMTVRNS
jgi:hypothetical protein